MAEKETTEVVDVEMIGDKAVDESELSPSVYFDHVKSRKKEFDTVEHNLIIDSILTKINKAKITGQTAMAKQLAHMCDIAFKELDAVNAGFNIYCLKTDIEKYIDLVEGTAVKIIELKNYTREIPDEYMDRITKASEIFDELYIVFTDYALKETKKVAKERRSKDPIVFGAFIDNTMNDTKPYVEEKMFFICDWVEENCDLTLEELVKVAKKKGKEEITYKLETPKDVDDVKKMLDSYLNPPKTIYEPVTIFDKIKDKITKDDGEIKYSCECGELTASKYSPKKCPSCNTRLKKIKKS